MYRVNRHKVILGLLLSAAFSSCSLHPSSFDALSSAQEVVLQADSLRAEGGMFDDSLRLAQSYGILDKWQLFYPDDYAHACYHYGRLLREKDDPVSAMQVFINATNSRTRDYHILGRIYSNMGDLCHLASEFPLSYDMFEHAAEMFLLNRDTLSYYYNLSRMAFEKASLADLEACREIIKEIS